MAAKETNVKIVDEIIRLQGMEFGRRKIARTLSIHRDTVKNYLEDNSPENFALNLSLPVTNAKQVLITPSDSWASGIDWQAIREQVLLGISLNVIHDEMVKKNAISIQYPAFWKQLQKRAPTTSATMVRIFAPGSRTEIDYCDGINLINLGTGEIIKTEFFVGDFCNSRYCDLPLSLDPFFLHSSDQSHCA